MKKNNSLIIIGSGIKTISHISFEALSYLKQSEKVLYSVNEPILEQWIHKQNINAESLDNGTYTSLLRSKMYDEMVQVILNNLRIFKTVCVLFYGHPTVFAKTTLKAAIEAKKLGFNSKVIPAISAEDCLFADLLIDPGTHGCQSFEATDFLIRQRPLSIHSHLILWQIGVIGALADTQSHHNSKGINILTDYLIKFYPKNHEVVCYEASLYPHLDPIINKCKLEFLPKSIVSTLTTLYVPPIPTQTFDYSVIRSLEIKIDSL